MTVVVETSAVVEHLLSRTSGRLRAAFTDDVVASAHLIDFEVVSAVRGRWLGNKLTSDEAATAVGNYALLPIHRVTMTASLREILAMGSNFTAYDAAYLVLAKHLDAPLLTSDEKYRAAGRLGVDVQVID